jgi:hypothetical protein
MAGGPILQYVDGTILLMEYDLEKVVNRKLISCSFEQLPHRKINFHKLKYFVLPKLKKLRKSTLAYLLVRLSPYLLSI